MKTIKARVNWRLLSNADRLFTGTLGGRVIEILQNARRAGATRVEIVNADGWVVVKDNGKGIEDFSKLLDLGGSDWDEGTELSENPAGVGLFCLSPRELVIRSHGQAVRIEAGGWCGKPVEIEKDDDAVDGTELRFRDDPWDLATVEGHAVFSGLKVTVDRQECKCLPFVGDSAIAHPELGCRIEVRYHDEMGEWHRPAGARYVYDNVLVNFHGQVVSFEYLPTRDRSLFFLIEMTGEPTGIRLMLPARTTLVENESFDALKRVLEVEAYRHYLRVGEHRLRYSEYLRARELGIDLPEAKPVFEVGLIDRYGPPKPLVEVAKPEGLPLTSCYRLKPNLNGMDGTNAHLLAALGTFSEPFVPVSIMGAHDGYNWAKLATIDEVEVQIGKQLHGSSVWLGKLICVETITITARTSDGKIFSSSVCMAVLPPERGRPGWKNPNRVYVTPEARKRLDTGEMWFHLGGRYGDSDHYDSEAAAVSNDLAVFWADLVGPDESWRLRLLEATSGARHAWRAITISREGSVDVVLADGSTKTIKPPAGTPAPSPVA